jgi:3-deoxy-D-manno-octulosonic-acid transferase
VNLLILLYLLIMAPKLLIDRVLKGKRHPELLQRLGFRIPKANRPVIWIHGVSVGEIKAAQPLFRELRQKEPNAFFLITTTSATGQAEAKRSLPEADAFAYLPVDLSWVVNRWVKQLNPKRFILMESDFWYNLLSALKRNGTQISLVSGKMSERSARRFKRFSFFAKKLFSHFNHLCLQNEDHLQRFIPLVADPSKLQVTGNLKLDIKPQKIEGTLDFPQPIITISCTHATEEELLLDALQGGEWFLILAPRHPERFEAVAELLTKKNIPFSRWSDSKREGKVLLLDAMGQLPICYAHSSLAILGGSFVTHIGGHNILEPCLYGAPVLFGPHMKGQAEFAKRALESGAGLQISPSEIRSTVVEFFNNPKKQQMMRRSALELIQASRGSTLRTLTVLLGG